MKRHSVRVSEQKQLKLAQITGIVLNGFGVFVKLIAFLSSFFEIRELHCRRGNIYDYKRALV